MHYFRLFCLALLALLLIACQPGTQVVPTAAQLPSPTPQPTSAPTDEVFFTPTPTGEALPSGENGGSGGATQVPTQAGGESPGAFASPTPETEEVLGTEESILAESGPCSGAEMQAALAQSDLSALRAELDAFMERLRLAAGTLGDWTLSGEPDPLAGVVAPNALPIAQLRYRRGEAEEMIFLVSLAPGAIGSFLRGCISTEAFYRQADVPDGALLTLEPLSIGDQGVLVTITVPTSPEIVEAEMGNITTTVGAVLVGDRYVQYIGAAPFATTTSQEDALALLAAVVEAVREL